VKERYQIVGRQGRASEEALNRFTQAGGQFLLPLVELVTEARLAVDDVIGQVSRKMIETILGLSAQQVAGPRTPGKASGEVRWHGSQAGRVMLRDRQMQVTKPRLRRKNANAAGEVAVPAYEALRTNPDTAERMLGAMLAGVSTRYYKEVLPRMASTVGVSRSAISRQAIEASEEQLRQLNERRWDAVNLLVIYCDGQRFGEHHIISAVGVDLQGRKHVLGMESGATENAASVKRLFTRLRDNGLKTDQKYLFVIDGAKALAAAIHEVFGTEQPVQRCRKHKERNVLAELPKEQHPNVQSLLRAAWKSPHADDGIKRVEQLARFYERDYPKAAQSLREGLAEMFTLQRLQIPPIIHKCLATTNLIESPQSGVRRRTLKISRWRDQDMALRWAASAWLATEKHFHKVDGHQQLWALANILGRQPESNAAPQFKVA
jgi:transposase-like protein